MRITRSVPALERASHARTVAGTGGDDRLVGDSANDLLVGQGGSDDLLGKGGDDELLGNAGADTLSGGGGVDILHGGRGGDALFGGKGADVLYGEFGTDRLTGEGGSDTFAFAARTADAAEDLVTDWQAQDHVALIGFDAGSARLQANGPNVDLYASVGGSEVLVASFLATTTARLTLADIDYYATDPF